MKSNRLLEKCDNQLKQVLSIYSNLTDSLRLNLHIESKSQETESKSFLLLIDNKETNISIPGFRNEFPLKVRKFYSIFELLISLILVISTR